MAIDIYRIEAPVKVGDEIEWYGPFTAFCYDPSLTRANLDYTRYLEGYVPEPEEDGIPNLNSLIYGFNTLESFLLWLPRRCWWAIKDHRFVINHYKVEEGGYHIGKTQIGFHPDKAKLVGSVDYSDLMDKLEADFVT